MSLSEEGEEDGRATIGGIENIAVRRIGFMNAVTNILFGKQVLVWGDPDIRSGFTEHCTEHGRTWSGLVANGLNSVE